jgi:hypothetical protein
MQSSCSKSEVGTQRKKGPVYQMQCGGCGNDKVNCQDYEQCREWTLANGKGQVQVVWRQWQDAGTECNVCPHPKKE